MSVEYSDPPGVAKEPYSRAQDHKVAASEEATMRKESMERLSADHGRTEKLKDALSVCVVYLVYFLFGLFIIAIGCVAWHHLGPPERHWISESTLDTITATIFSGSFFAAFGLYIRDRIKPPSV